MDELKPDDEKAKCLSKLTFATRELAAAAAAYAVWQYGKSPSAPRPYRCRVCQLWHLGRPAG